MKMDRSMPEICLTPSAGASNPQSHALWISIAEVADAQRYRSGVYALAADARRM
jgi:hypothetical protein